MRACPKCKRTYPDDTEFCPRDGTALPSAGEVSAAEVEAGLARRFHVVRRLGAGGMGTVYLAEQLAVGNRPVALKVLLRKLLDDPEFLLRFQNEAASTGRIRHANVVTIYESGQSDDGSPYIAMEYLEGETLRQVLERRGGLPLPECADILQQAARGLNSAHKLGILHRDLKPDNIFLTRSEDGDQVVKVMDFGLAKMRESAAHTLTGTVLGTPVYMSPEQCLGMKSEQLDARSDIYSLAVIVYELLTGRVPFRSETPIGYLHKHVSEAPPPLHAAAPGLAVPPHVETVLMKALAKARDERHVSATEFSREFSAAASSAARAPAPVPAPTTSSVTRVLDRLEPTPEAGTVKVNPIDGLKYVWIPPGTFLMGCSPRDNSATDPEKPAHQVTISKGFWMGQTPVTVAAYQRFAATTGRPMPPAPEFNNGWMNPDMPIVNVTWDEAQAYCQWVGGRLPTEAEWEYAARAGTTTPRYGPLDEIAWYGDNSGRQRLDCLTIYANDRANYDKKLQENGNGTHDVGQNRANPWGLHDTLGNVWEWVSDWHAPNYYQHSPSQDPAGPESGKERSVRGGSWMNLGLSNRVSARAGIDPTVGVHGLGLRCVCETAPPAPGTVRQNAKDGLRYVWIPPGKFMMGCSAGDSEASDQEKPAHQVTITKGFWMGQTLVTVAAYRRFTEATGRPMPSAPYFNVGWQNQDMPIVKVNWDDSQAYCEWAGGRLPTEAEWEYAARGGSSEAIYGPLDEIAWFAYNSGPQPVDTDALWKEDAATIERTLIQNGNAPCEVGQKRANPFQLYDTLGNLLEWVSDWYDPNYYQQSPPRDPPGPTNGQERVNRGGCWCNRERDVRVSARFKFDPTKSSIVNGLRCVLETAAPTHPLQPRLETPQQQLTPPPAPPPRSAPAKSGGEESGTGRPSEAAAEKPASSPEPVDPKAQYVRGLAFEQGIKEAARLLRKAAKQASAPALGAVRENPRDGLHYVWIPPGTFMMGCSPGDDECYNAEKPAHQVTISQGFWIAQTPVTVRAYKRFAAATGRDLRSELNFNPNWMNEDMPMCCLSWVDAQAYCQWAGGRLPTDAEWEYAARGGSTAARYGELDEIAWYEKNSDNRTHDVGQKPPNGFGLYDTLGNVWEWVNDWYDENYYQSSPAQDPPGPSSGQFRVLRGGSWEMDSRRLRVSNRSRSQMDIRQSNCGFRCVWKAETPSGQEDPASEELARQVIAKLHALEAPAAGAVRPNPKDGLKYVWIPPGTFMMGCSPGDSECRDPEKPAHQVTISKGFWIGQTPVTVAAYKRFAAEMEWDMPPPPKWDLKWENMNAPIVDVTWEDAQAYCEWAGGRLPTEAEWEYAARAGKPRKRYGERDEIAWYNVNSEFRTHDVAQKPPNGFGLYDTLGNVAEWVNDWFDENYYQGSPAQDPPGPSSGQSRVVRGACWGDNPFAVRVSYRDKIDPAIRYPFIGLRCVLEAGIL